MPTSRRQKSAGRSEWVVTLAGRRTPAQVARALAAAGFEVIEVMDAIGVISGRAAGSLVPTLRKVEGVATISPTPSAGVGPPDAEIS